jgi:hypothetical protein
MHLGVWPVVASIHLGSVTPKQQLKCCSCGGNHTATYRGCSKWKERRRPLQNERKGSAAERMASPRICQRPDELQLSLLPNRRILALAGTTLSEAAASSRLRLLPLLHPLHPTQEDGPSGRLPQRAANVSLLVLKCRWWNPSHPVPNRLTQHPLPHRVSLHSRGSPISKNPEQCSFSERQYSGSKQHGILG